MEVTSSNSANGRPSPAKCQAQFHLGVTLSLFLWPSLTLAVTSHWGGPDSASKREWFAQTTIDLLSEEGNEDVDAEWIEEFLLQVMLDEFEVNVDDDSAFEVAEQIVKLRSACGRGEFAEIEEMQRRWESRGGNSVGGVFRRAEDEDGETDGSSDDDEGEEEDAEGDVEMDEAPQLVRVREPVVPEVDEDGFTKVTKKKR